MIVAKIYLEWTTTFIIFPSVSRINGWAKKKKQKQKKNKTKKTFTTLDGTLHPLANLFINITEFQSKINLPPIPTKKKKTLLIT